MPRPSTPFPLSGGCEQLRHNLLLRWFVGLPMDEPVFRTTSFAKNRKRLLTSAVAEASFRAVRSQAETHRLLSREHFSLDGTLLEAAASLKSLAPIEQGEDKTPPPAGGGRNPNVDFHGQKRSNATHRSSADPEAHLTKKAAIRSRGCVTPGTGWPSFTRPGAVTTRIDVRLTVSRTEVRGAVADSHLGHRLTDIPIHRGALLHELGLNCDSAQGGSGERGLQRVPGAVRGGCSDEG